MHKIPLAAATAAALIAVALLVVPAGADDVPTRQSVVSLVDAPVAGGTVTAKGAAWSKEPDRRAYEWLLDGEGDVLGREATYAVTPAEVGHVLVVVERVWFGSTQDETSSAPAPVAAPPASAPLAAPSDVVVAPAPPQGVARNVVRPTIKGTAKVGKTLRIRSKGSWDAPGRTFSYQWLRNGKIITKATRSSYELTAKDRGKRITLRVTAAKTGAPSVSAVSPRTGKVTK